MFPIRSGASPADQAMASLINAFLLVFVITGCSAMTGHVMSFAPIGEFQYSFSVSENDVQDNKFTVDQFTIPIVNEDRIGIDVTCSKFLINIGVPSMREEIRAAIMLNKVEIDSLEVEDCKEDEFKSTIRVEKTYTQKNKEIPLKITFTTDESKCFERPYQIVWTKDGEGKAHFTIKRGLVSELVDGYIKKKCPIYNKNGVVKSWLDDGENAELSTYKGVFRTTYALDQVMCKGCFVLCQEEKTEKETIYHTYVFIERIPVELMKTDTCTEESLKRSIKFMEKTKGENREEVFKIQYTGTNGACVHRTYRLTIHKCINTEMFQKAILIRENIAPADCYIILEGYFQTAANELQNQLQNKVLGPKIVFWKRISIEK